MLLLIVCVAIAAAVLLVLEPGGNNSQQRGLGLLAVSQALLTGGWPVRVSFLPKKNLFSHSVAKLNLYRAIRISFLGC